jgi:hypothetical protein
VYLNIFLISLTLISAGYMFQNYWGNRALKAYSWVLIFLLAALSFGSYFLDVSQNKEFHKFIIFNGLIFGTPLILGLMMIYYSRNTPLGLRVFFALAASGVVVVALPFGVLIIGCGLGLDCI